MATLHQTSLLHRTLSAGSPTYLCPDQPPTDAVPTPYHQNTSPRRGLCHLQIRTKPECADLRLPLGSQSSPVLNRAPSQAARQFRRTQGLRAKPDLRGQRPPVTPVPKTRWSVCFGRFGCPCSGKEGHGGKSGLHMDVFRLRVPSRLPMFTLVGDLLTTSVSTRLRHSQAHASAPQRQEPAQRSQQHSLLTSLRQSPTLVPRHRKSNRTGGLAG